MAKLTSRYVEGCKGDPNKPSLVSDDQVPGLYLRVSPAGRKSWVYRYTRTDGARAKHGLGRFPGVGLADAREKAIKVMAQVSDGRDPARERTIEKRAARRPRLERPQTLADYWALYDRDIMPAKRASTQKYQRWLWSHQVAPRLGHIRLAELDRAAVRVALKEIGAAGPTTANRALGLVRHMLNVAVDDEWMLASPISRMGNLFKESSRDRVLRDDEVRTLWRALDAAPGAELGISARLAVYMWAT